MASSTTLSDMQEGQTDRFGKVVTPHTLQRLPISTGRPLLSRAISPPITSSAALSGCSCRPSGTVLIAVILTIPLNSVQWNIIHASEMHDLGQEADPGRTSRARI